MAVHPGTTHPQRLCNAHTQHSHAHAHLQAVNIRLCIVSNVGVTQCVRRGPEPSAEGREQLHLHLRQGAAHIRVSQQLLHLKTAPVRTHVPIACHVNTHTHSLSLSLSLTHTHAHTASARSSTLSICWCADWRPNPTTSL